MTFINNGNHQNSIRRSKKCFQKVCSTKVLKRRLPIIEWLPKYDVGTLIQDIIAGLTIGLTAIPQGIAYAGITGLPPEYGLYSSLTAGVIYAFLGSCKDISVGPTAILSAITAKYVSSYSADFAVLTAFLSGVLILAMGVFRLGFLVEFISLPVISGFTTAAVLQISASQLKALFGLNGRSGNYFAESVYNFVYNIRTINLWDTVLGLSTIVSLVLLKRLGEGCNRRDPCIKKIRWLISLARNTVVVAVGIVVSFIISKFVESENLTLIGEVNGGLPSFGLPPFKTVVNNETYSFVEMVQILGPQPLIVIPLVAVLEIVVISKAFAEGRPIDVTQEILTLGICNIVGSFGKSMPITAAFSRTTLNHVSGVQTTFGGILTCILIALSLTLLTSVFSFIPKASLAALIITAIYSMIDVATTRSLWRNRKKEFIVLFITLSVSLLYGLEFGIIAGVLSEAGLVIYYQARPELDINIIMCGRKKLIVINLPSSAMYCSAEYLRRKLLKVSSSHIDSVIILDGTNLSHLDFSVASNIMSSIKDLDKKCHKIVLMNFKPIVSSLCIDIYPESINKFVTCKSYSDAIDL